MNKDMEKTKHFDLPFLDLAISYLHTAQSILGETSKKWNPWMVAWDQDSSQDYYDEETRWSDFNVFVPTLFLFYHWLELTIKWSLIMLGEDVETNHWILNLFSVLKKASWNDLLVSTIEKYLTSNSFVSGLLLKNNKKIDDFYDLLKYPTDKNFGEIYNYDPIRFTEDKWFGFAKNIVEDINSIRIEMVKEYRKHKWKYLDIEN